MNQRWYGSDPDLPDLDHDARLFLLAVVALGIVFLCAVGALAMN